MCNKASLTKHFFVLLNHPLTHTKPLVVGVLKNKPHVHELYTKTQQGILTPAQVERLGYPSSVSMRAYLLPIQIPWMWCVNEN